jgi:hypothetical protein
MYRKFIIGTMLVMSLVFFVSAAFAQTYNGTVDITCTDFTAAGTGPHVLDRDNTGSGLEAVRIDVTDGAGTLLYTLTFGNVLGSYAGGMIGTTAYTTAPQSNPITVTVTSLAGNGLPEQATVIGQGTCDSLLIPATPPAPPTQTICLSPVPDGSVIGEMPFDTQAYWAPGQIATDVIINAGTYYVFGVDETGEWYKIGLACNYLWVPVTSMQPSDQAPQNGAPLPTRIVE